MWTASSRYHPRSLLELSQWISLQSSWDGIGNGIAARINLQNGTVTSLDRTYFSPDGLGDLQQAFAISILVAPLFLVAVSCEDDFW